MKGTRFGQNFFESTRGRVMEFIRDGASTVEEISNKLDLTDNAVRAHLATLERDRLVEQHGLQRGSRKPHYSYRLTREAEQLFPKAYHALLGRLLSVLKLRLEPGLLQEILHDVAGLLATGLDSGVAAKTPEGRAEKAIEVLKKIGGSARIERSEAHLIVRSGGGCPFSEIVSEHPEICRLAEALLREVTGGGVCEQCDRGDVPRCSFQIIAEGLSVDPNLPTVHQ